MRRARIAWVALLAISAATAACSAILGLDAPASPDGPADATTVDDASSEDSGVKPPPPTCAPLNAPGANAVTYSPLSQAAVGDAGEMTWSFFDGAQLAGLKTPFAGGAFDGRYVYFAGEGAHVGRFDTTGSFTETASWSTRNVTTIGAPGGFSSAVFDGRYAYFIPSSIGGAPASIIARYDPQGTFGAATSWTTFDLSVLNADDAGAPTKGFIGGVFDGRYIYLVPHNDGAFDGRVVRYDTVAPPDAGAPDGGDAGDAGPSSDFGDLGRWSSFDVSTTNSLATGFTGGVFAGNFIYLVPNTNNAFNSQVHGGASSIAARHPIDSGLTSSWSTFDTTLVNGLADLDFGGAFDGRYVYLIPHTQGVATRFDTKATTFNSTTSWSAYDTARVATLDGSAPAAFAGGAFDGRFIYLVPNSAAAATIARYDTTSTFTADCAWSSFNLTSLNPAEGGTVSYAGAVFDGQYLYLVPVSGSIFARFNAKTPSSMPNLPAFYGSFL